MATTKVSAQASSATLPQDIFGLEVKDHQLLHTALRSYLANRRTVGASTLKRGEVRGGGKKPWRQKGTGRARAGSTRSPLWRGGGVTFGPSGQENYSVGLPAKARKLATKQALSVKAADKAVRVVPELVFKTAKSKEMVAFLAKYHTGRQVILVVDKPAVEIKRAAGNIAGLRLSTPGALNVFDVLKSDTILITPSALKILATRLASEGSKSPVVTRKGHKK